MSTYDGRKPEPPYPADLDQVIADIAAELRCEPDNEVILARIAHWRQFIENLDGKTICIRQEDGFIDDGIVVASDFLDPK